MPINMAILTETEAFVHLQTAPPPLMLSFLRGSRVVADNIAMFSKKHVSRTFIRKFLYIATVLKVCIPKRIILVTYMLIHQQSTVALASSEGKKENAACQ